MRLVVEGGKSVGLDITSGYCYTVGGRLTDKDDRRMPWTAFTAPALSCLPVVLRHGRGRRWGHVRGIVLIDFERSSSGG
jgi:hypothetical protein